MLIPYDGPQSGYSEEEIKKTTLEYSEFFSKKPNKNATTIIDAHIDASFGTRPTDNPFIQEREDNEFELHEDSISKLLGRYGNPH